MQYSQEALEEMSQKINLLEYASQSVDFIKQSGNTHYALCPFHNEKTPSLAIDTNRGYWHCFGCGRSGNIYNWIQQIENISFSAAVEKVAKLTGTNFGECVESESMAFLKLMDRINSPKRIEVVKRDILDIDKDYYQKFSNELPQEWLDEGISADVMNKYEIRIDNRTRRIVYPVYDADFNFIGIKGRTRLKNYKDLKIMKYTNYYKVGILDYFQGMKQAEQFVKDSRQIIIVEGLKSVMKLDQWGYHNTVAAETSKINDYQIELLLRMQLRDVVIAFDKDVKMQKTIDSIKHLKMFTNVWIISDRYGLLENKDSPCDKGLDVFKRLYEEKYRV